MQAPFGASAIKTSRLGLGCSHIASLSTRPSARQIAALLDQAYDGGIRFFDTADIYGQGDSEKRLARVAARNGTVICTKAGLRLKSSQTAIRLVKPVLRPLLQRVKGAGRKAAAMRQASEDINFELTHLESRLESSLRRLRRDHVEVFLLHSPPRDALQDGALFDLLDRLRDRGLAQVTGVSTRTLDDARWVLDQNRVGALQIPLPARDLAQATPLLDTAAKAGVGVIAREVLSGLATRDADSMHNTLRPLFANPAISTILTGTTSSAHLAQNLALAHDCLNGASA